MKNKKIIMSLLLVVLVALSLGVVSAEDPADSVADNPAIEVSGNSITPSTTDAAGVQEAVNSASSGDTILLGDKTYDFADATVTVNQKDKLTFKGDGVSTTIKGHGEGKGLFHITESANVTFIGIKFIDTNPVNNIVYGGSIKGHGINFDGIGSSKGTVDNCSFKDFNQAVVVNKCNNVTVKNSNFTGGIATKLINDPTVNKESGSKMISAGGSFYLKVINNTFDGRVLDAISIAKGSGDASIIGNTFKNNAYSIYFGGASTEGTYIFDNTFIKCGQFELDNGTVWGEFPVISIQKASEGVFFNNNTFYVVNNNLLIAAESSNPSHGAPSTLGNINVTNNKIIKAEGEDVIGRSVTLIHILSRSGDLNPKAPITITNNTFFAGVRPLVIWYNDWGNEDGEIVIPQAPEPTPIPEHVATDIAASNLNVYAGNNGVLKLTLKDVNGNAVANKMVTIVIDGVTKTATTDDNGIATLNVKYASSGTHYATMVFTGDANYTGATKTVKISVLKKATSLTTAKKTFKVKAKTKKVTATLKSGKTVLKDKKVTLKVNGKTYTAKTNAKGVATFSIKLAKKGTFNAYYKFAGDGAYKAISKKNTIVIKK